MKHLFLTSIGITGFLKYVDKPADQLKAVYIPTAANPYEDKWFIDNDRKLSLEAGINITEFNLKDIDDQSFDEELERLLEGIDVLIVSGGNTFYLLQETIRTNFEAWVKRHIEKGGWYVGASAGAVLACPNIEPVKYFDNPEDAPNLKNYEGLGLVDFVILPHYEPDKHDENYDKAIADCKKLGLPYQLLTDQQSIIVEGDKWRIVEG